MEAPITEEEMKKALLEEAPGKSPRPDGFTLFYYKKYKEILVPKLCQYMNGLGVDYEISREGLMASITVILKEGKEETCSSYRPISLLNADIKLYAKVLAGRLKGLMNTLVNPDQVGFTSKIEGRDNGVKTLLLLQKIKKSGPQDYCCRLMPKRLSTG